RTAARRHGRCPGRAGGRHRVIAQLDEYRTAVNRSIERAAARVDDDNVVSAATRYALEGGGKRLRPALCLAAMHAVRPGRATHPAALRAAASIELIHTYSLVHDDL